MITCNIQIFTTFFRCVPCDAQKIHQNLSFGFVNISYEGNQTLAQSQQQNQGLQYTWLISNKIKISMFFTPRTKRKDTQTTDFSSNNLSRVTNFHTNQLKKSVQSQQSLKTDKKPQNSNKQSDKLWPIAKLHINVKKKKVSEQEFIQESPTLKVNPFKYKSTTCSKMSTQPHGNIVAYGITSFKGHRNIVNPHFSSINLGHLNHITFSESFDGQNAAKIIKQQFRIQMANLSDKLKQDTYQVVSEAVKEVFQNVQHKVVEKQYLSQQNSGSTLLSVLFHPQFLMVANAGSSQVICLTKNGSLLKLSQSHTTINQKQRKRIIKNGGRIYQTVVNVPFHDELQIQGPLRISPSGLFFTRCLGKGLDFRKEISSLSQGEYNNPENHLNITWKPEIKYLNIEDVEWVGIFSEQILKNCSLQEIKNCVHSEMKKKSQQFSQHHIAQEASKKIIERLINGGVANALTCIIVLLKQVSPISKPQNQRQQISIKIRRRKAGQADNNMSLTYIGDRKSFVKQVSVSCGKDKSMSNKNKKTNERQLKRQFSFNPLH